MNYPRQIHYQTRTVFTPAGRPDEIVVRLIQPIGADPEPLQIYTQLAYRLRHEVQRQIRLYRPNWTPGEVQNNTQGLF